MTRETGTLTVMMLNSERPILNRANLAEFGRRWAVTVLAVIVAAHTVRGLSYDSFAGLLVASLVLGALNAVLRPLLLLLSLPLIVSTFGVFLVVINAALLYLVGAVVKSLHVADFWTAFWGALVISVVTVIANAVIGRPRLRVVTPPASADGPRRGPPPPDGPVIDV